MLTIKTATLESNELSEELDDASLQAITGGLATGFDTSASAAVGLSLLGIPLASVGIGAALSGSFYTV